MTAVQLKEVLKSGNYNLGTDSTFKKLKRGEVKIVFLASNCPDDIKNKVGNYKGVEIVHLKENSYDLAMQCKKQFNVNVISS